MNEKSKQEPGSIGVTMLACGQETEHGTLMQGNPEVAGGEAAVAASCVINRIMKKWLIGVENWNHSHLQSRLRFN